MAKPSTRQGLIDYCFRQLGAPVLEINVDEDQVDRDFIKIKETIHVDKKGIRSYIKDTGDVPDGVEFVQKDNVVVVK